jgi:hypothetical protein
VRADLDTLLIAVYCAACSLFPADPRPRRGRPQAITDNELLCLMVAQMLLGQPSDRRSSPSRTADSATSFRGCPASPAPTSAAGSWRRSWSRSGVRLPASFPASTTRSASSTPRRCPAGEASAPSTALSFALVRLRLLRRPLALLLGDAARALVRPGRHRPRLRPRPRQRTRARGRARAARASATRRSARDRRQGLRRPRVRGRPRRARRAAAAPQPHRRTKPSLPADRQDPAAVESIVNSLKDQLRLEHHLAKTPAGLLCRIAARILALNAAIHLNWQRGQPHRALTAYGH